MATTHIVNIIVLIPSSNVRCNCFFHGVIWFGYQQERFQYQFTRILYRYSLNNFCSDLFRSYLFWLSAFLHWRASHLENATKSSHRAGRVIVYYFYRVFLLSALFHIPPLQMTPTSAPVGRTLSDQHLEPFPQ